MYAHDPQNPEPPRLDYTCEVFIEDHEAPSGENVTVRCEYAPHRKAFFGDCVEFDYGDFTTLVPTAFIAGTWLHDVIAAKAMDMASDDDDAWGPSYPSDDEIYERAVGA